MKAGVAAFIFPYIERGLGPIAAVRRSAAAPHANAIVRFVLDYPRPGAGRKRYGGTPNRSDWGAVPFAGKPAPTEPVGAGLPANRQ